jgi:hypothetical protein
MNSGSTPSTLPYTQKKYSVKNSKKRLLKSLDLEQSYVGSDSVTEPPKWCQLSLYLSCSAWRKSNTPSGSSSPSHLRCPWLMFPTLCHLTSSSSKIAAYRRQTVKLSRERTHMGIFTIPIRPRWLLRHEWFAIILFIM